MNQQTIVHPNMQGYKDVTDQIGAILLTGSPATVTIEAGEKKTRSLPANALQQAWIREVADWQGVTEKYVRNYVKAELALPILLEDDTDIAKKIKYTLGKINYDLMTPAQRIEVMDMFNVTSILSTKQHNRFRDQMQRHYQDAGLNLVAR